MSRDRPAQNIARIGLALAGGGPQGAVYEIGALLALEEVLEGVKLHRDAHVYVGVSAGAFIASCLANGLTIGQLARSMFAERSSHPSAHPLHPGVLFRPAVGELVLRGTMVPRLFAESIADFLRNPTDQTLLESFSRLTRALPNGLFDNEPIRVFLARSFALAGRTDDFRELRRPLFVVAADLDSGEAVRFGEPGFDDIPISRAVQASTSVPGLYPPVSIHGRHYLDGVLLKTMHASVAVEHGANLLICVNPLVPVDTVHTVREGVMRRGKLVNRGFPTVMAQTFRTLIHSRLRAVIETYADVYPGVGLVLLEPPKDDYRMFFTNVFSVTDRRTVFEHAYRSTRRQLWERRDELTRTFDGYGIEFRADLLEDTERNPWHGVKPARERTATIAGDLGLTLDRLERLIG